MNVLRRTYLVNIKNIKFRTIPHEKSFARCFTETQLFDNIYLRNHDTEQKQPLVVLLGFMEGTMKQLKNYSVIFEEQNFTSLCVETSFIDTCFRYDTVAMQRASKITDIMSTKLMNNNIHRPVIFYTISNGGLTLFYHMTKNLKPGGLFQRNTVGIIFDSCPIVYDFDKMPGIMSDVSTLSIRNPMLKLVIGSITKPLYHGMLALKPEALNIIPTIKNCGLKSPQLYLFSKSDKVALYENILDFIKDQEDRKIDVTYKLWDNSEHVKHLSTHKQEYIQIVQSFIKKCCSGKAYTSL